MQETRRNPLSGLVLIAMTIFLGIGSRRFGHSLPGFVAAYAGDTLWALMAFLGIGLILKGCTRSFPLNHRALRLISEDEYGSKRPKNRCRQSHPRNRMIRRSFEIRRKTFRTPFEAGACDRSGGLPREEEQGGQDVARQDLEEKAQEGQIPAAVELGRR